MENKYIKTKYLFTYNRFLVLNHKIAAFGPNRHVTIVTINTD